MVQGVLSSGEGLHAADASIALANLVALGHSEAVSWLAGH